MVYDICCFAVQCCCNERDVKKKLMCLSCFVACRYMQWLNFLPSSGMSRWTIRSTMSRGTTIQGLCNSLIRYSFSEKRSVAPFRWNTVAWDRVSTTGTTVPVVYNFRQTLPNNNFIDSRQRCFGRVLHRMLLCINDQDYTKKAFDTASLYVL
jgi:hypothetical protein